MSENCKILSAPCAEQGVEHVPVPTPPFSICVGTNRLDWDGYALRVHQGSAMPDGEYTAFTVRDGCIVEAGQAPVPEYTPPPCVESPAPCSGETGAATVSPRAGNLTADTPTGLYTQVSVVNGLGITVTGTGASGDPIVISAPGSTGPIISAGTPDISVTTPTAGVIAIGLNSSGITPGTYAGITFNSRGIATAYSAPSVSAVQAVVGAGEVNGENVSGGVTISLKPTTAGGASYDIGGYSVAVSQGGVVSTVTRVINLPAGVYSMGAYNVTVNGLGSITGITRSVTLVAGTFTTTDGKTVRYDEFGTITQIT
jgi:hypothetical protein